MTARCSGESSFSPRRIPVSSLFRPRSRTRTSSSATGSFADSNARAASASRASSRSVMGKRLGRGLCLFRYLGQTRERLLVANGEVGQDLPIDIDLGHFQAADERAVGEAVETRGGIDPHDPQPAKVPLLGPPVAVGELQAAHERLARGLVELAPSAA